MLLGVEPNRPPSSRSGILTRLGGSRGGGVESREGLGVLEPNDTCSSPLLVHVLAE